MSTCGLGKAGAKGEGRDPSRCSSNTPPLGIGARDRPKPSCGGRPGAPGMRHGAPRRNPRAAHLEYPGRHYGAQHVWVDRSRGSAPRHFGWRRRARRDRSSSALWGTARALSRLLREQVDLILQHADLRAATARHGIILVRTKPATFDARLCISCLWRAKQSS